MLPDYQRGRDITLVLHPCSTATILHGCQCSGEFQADVLKGIELSFSLKGGAADPEARIAWEWVIFRCPLKPVFLLSFT